MLLLAAFIAAFVVSFVFTGVLLQHADGVYSTARISSALAPLFTASTLGIVHFRGGINALPQSLQMRFPTLPQLSAEMVALTTEIAELVDSASGVPGMGSAWERTIPWYYCTADAQNETCILSTGDEDAAGIVRSLCSTLQTAALTAAEPVSVTGAEAMTRTLLNAPGVLFEQLKETLLRESGLVSQAVLASALVSGVIVVVLVGAAVVVLSVYVFYMMRQASIRGHASLLTLTMVPKSSIMDISHAAAGQRSIVDSSAIRDTAAEQHTPSLCWKEGRPRCYSQSRRNYAQQRIILHTGTTEDYSHTCCICGTHYTSDESIRIHVHRSAQQLIRHKHSWQCRGGTHAAHIESSAHHHIAHPYGADQSLSADTAERNALPAAHTQHSACLLCDRHTLATACADATTHSTALWDELSTHTDDFSWGCQSIPPIESNAAE